MKEIKAIIFDVGGVLMKGSKPVHEVLADEFGKDLDVWFDIIEPDYSNTIIGKQTEESAMKTISKKLEISSSNLKKVWEKAYAKYYRLNKGLLEIALKLKDQGYVIAILSDQSHMSYNAFERLGFFEHFNPKIFSQKAGIRKPDKKLYEIIISKLKKMKIKSGECVFIDNNEWALEPAEKLGMKGILFKDNDQVVRELKKLGVGDETNIF